MYAGIDIGGTTIKGAIVSAEGEWLHFARIQTAKAREAIVDDLVSLLRLLTESQQVHINEIHAIAIGTAGSIDREKGTIISIPNIPALADFPLASHLQERTGTRVFLENDAKVAVEAEIWKGSGSSYKNWLFLALGTGIGGGIVINGEVYTGRHGSAAEFGHVTIKFDGLQCPCGNTGCLEQYASAGAVVRMATDHLALHPESSLNMHASENSLSAETVYTEAKKGDTCASEVMQMTGSYLGIGIAGLVNIFNPEAVIIGGGMSGAHEFLIPIISETVNHRALPGMKENIAYHASVDPGRAPAFGAARIAMKNLQ